MRKIFSLLVLSLCVAAPSFAADVVGRSVKAAGKNTGKAIAVAGKDSAKATVKAVKFLF